MHAPLRLRRERGAGGEGESLTTDALLPPAPARVHFVGIGGIGMSGLARILNAWGYAVSGSDAAPSPLLEELKGEGIAVTIGHSATDAAAEADLVVATAAVRPDNPEIAAALAAGRPLVKRARLLGALADARRGVAVAGSHGKSTTSGMIVAALRALGADPSFAIGAVLAGAGTNAAPGAGEEMVVEADEYDWSFLHLHPRRRGHHQCRVRPPRSLPRHGRLRRGVRHIRRRDASGRNARHRRRRSRLRSSDGPAGLVTTARASSPSAKQRTPIGGWSGRRRDGGSPVPTISPCLCRSAFRGDIMLGTRPPRSPRSSPWATTPRRPPRHSSRSGSRAALRNEGRSARGPGNR